MWCGYSGPVEWNFTYGPLTAGLVPPAYRGIREKELLMGSEFAAKIGVNQIATHVGFLPENYFDPDFRGTVGTLRKICKVMQERGQYFLFETGQETPVTVLRAIEEIGLDNVGINFDTANLMLYGKECAAGEGLANFPLGLKRLKDVGYTGPFTIEREIKGEQQKADIIKARDMLLEIEKTL